MAGTTLAAANNLLAVNDDNDDKLYLLDTQPGV
jgi:hypothetical protein